jgi:hypothetical protein
MKQDRFLMGILIFIGVLVIAALVLFFARPSTAVYQPDDTPAGVVYNFALAVQSNDYGRAYASLADLENKPSEVVFRQGLIYNSSGTDGYAIQIDETQMLDSENAWVNVSIHYLSSGPFDNGWTSVDHAVVVRQNGVWKVSLMPYPYWSYDWYQPTTVPTKP